MLVAKMTVPVMLAFTADLQQDGSEDDCTECPHIRIAASASWHVRPRRICTGLKTMMREAGCAVGPQRGFCLRLTPAEFSLTFPPLQRLIFSHQRRSALSHRRANEIAVPELREIICQLIPSVHPADLRVIPAQDLSRKLQVNRCPLVLADAHRGL